MISNLDSLPAEVRVDLVNKTVSIDNIEKDFNITLELKKIEYDVTIKIVYSDGEYADTVDRYQVSHGSAFLESFEFNEDYRIKTIGVSHAGVSVNKSAKTVSIGSVTRDIAVTITLR